MSPDEIKVGQCLFFEANPQSPEDEITGLHVEVTGIEVPGSDDDEDGAPYVQVRAMFYVRADELRLPDCDVCAMPPGFHVNDCPNIPEGQTT